ncbi:arylamine N-acetyltransferase [Lacibacterium aquatile]|uniref:Arylamine N-acetyltransferase n=1 Tax=Lacibacterium aquatile TaxID=1168082 RepID=A0ABW5DVU6_9PROT
MSIAVTDFDAAIDLDAYLARIGLSGPVQPTEDWLIRLHSAHAQAVPFENLDIFLGTPIRGDLPGIFDKLVTRGRGGYCFEQNGLFGAMLAKFGFEATSLLGRTTFGSPSPRPRGHLITQVRIGQQLWIADVGFGGYGLIEPLRFEPEVAQQAGGETYRIIASSTGFEVEMRTGDAWKSLYWCDFAPCFPVDVEVLNFYHGHSAASFFNQNRVVARTFADHRLLLTNNELKTVTKNGIGPAEVIDGLDQYKRVLAERFGIRLPEGVLLTV